MNRRRGERSFLKDLWRDERGAFAVFLTLTLPVTIGFTTLAVDGVYVWTLQNQLQIAADAAALAGAQYAGSDTATSTPNPCTGTSASPELPDVEALLLLRGDARCRKPACRDKLDNTERREYHHGGLDQFGKLRHVHAAPVWNIPPNAVKATVSLNALPLMFTPMLSGLIQGANFGHINLSASATAAFLGWPQNLTFQLIGAKGWYYKTVTLYALPWSGGVAGTSYTKMGQWVYQPTTLAAASGSGNVNVAPDGANGMQTLNLGSMGSGSGTLTGPLTVNLGQYADIFMVESVMQGPCPPSTPWVKSNWSSGWSSGQCSATQTSTYNTQESVGVTACTKSQTTSGPAYASYNSICNPNAASSPTSSKTSSNQCQNVANSPQWNNCNSSYTDPWQLFYVDFFPAYTNANTNFYSTSVSPSTSFPCGQKVYHEWEDGGSTLPTSYSNSLSSATNTGTTPQQDFFYAVTTQCGSEPGMTESGYYSANPLPQLVQ